MEFESKDAPGEKIGGVLTSSISPELKPSNQEIDLRVMVPITTVAGIHPRLIVVTHA